MFSLEKDGVPTYNFKKNFGFEFSRKFYQEIRGLHTIFTRILLVKLSLEGSYTVQINNAAWNTDLIS